MNRPHISHNVFYPPREPGVDTKASLNRNGRGTTSIRALLPRASTCVGPDCPTGSGTPTGLIIGLAAAIPIVTCLIALIFLHRRHVKKQRLEDANDRHKSLDFGLDSPSSRQNKHGVPEMLVTDAEKEVRRQRGMSMDLSSQFVLPAALQGSRDSLHSLARTMHDDDPYRPVTFMKDDSASVLSHGRSRPSNLSIYSTSTGSPSDSSNSNLLKNSQRLSNPTPLPKSTTTSSSDLLLPQIQLPEPAQTITRKEITTTAQKGPPPSAVTEVSLESRVEGMGNAEAKPIHNVAAPIRSRQFPIGSAGLSTRQAPAQRPYIQPPKPLPQAKVYKTESPVIPSQPQTVRPPRLHTMEASTRNVNTFSAVNQSQYGEAADGYPPVAASGLTSNPGWPLNRSTDAPMPAIAEHEQPAGLGVHGLGYDLHRLSVGTRPLPPDDANDNPEQRANRIRSFYKEYFDPSKPDIATQPGRTDYYEDYSQEYLNNGAVFDRVTGRFVVAQAPYAQPVTRRAMTPPPRAPPRFKGATPGRVSSGSSSGHMATGQGRFPATSKTPNTGPRGRAPAPGKQTPPPAPLQTLPTPHMLKEDSMVFSAIDFAPPASYRERQAGRSTSPLGEKKPYSPTIKAHTPLASPFIDLAHMPSPHALRNSGSFTGLDFAPVPRFPRTSEVGSDAGSVRSNRSGMSQAQLRSVRSGAYRVSRIPKEWVGTKDDLAVSLRPTWDLRR